MTSRPDANQWVLRTVAVAGIVCLGFSTLTRADDDDTAPPAPSPAPGRTATQPEGAQEHAPDKGQFNLFNPTPRDLMRDLEPDRPDQTEGPYTIDAGHYQIESDVVNYTYDRVMPGRQNVRAQSLVALDPTLRVGLLNNIEGDISITPFLWEKTDDINHHITDTRSGFGDTILKAKINLWGNDEGKTAFGLIPFVKIPTSSDHLANHFVDGGLVFPFNIVLPEETEIGMMTELDARHDDVGSGEHAEWVNSIVLQKGIVKETLGAYIEFFSIVSNQRHAGPVETVDVGLLYAVSADIQLDAGCNFGISRPATDFNPFIGFTVRF